MYFQKEAILTFAITYKNKIISYGIGTRTYNAFLNRRKETNTGINYEP